MHSSEQGFTEGAHPTRAMPAVTLQATDPPELAESWFGRARTDPPPPRPPPPSRPPPRLLQSIDDPLADAWFR